MTEYTTLRIWRKTLLKLRRIRLRLLGVPFISIIDMLCDEWLTKREHKGK